MLRFSSIAKFAKRVKSAANAQVVAKSAQAQASRGAPNRANGACITKVRGVL